MHSEYCIENMGAFYQSNSKELAVKKGRCMYLTLLVNNEEAKYTSLGDIGSQLLI